MLLRTSAPSSNSRLGIAFERCGEVEILPGVGVTVGHTFAWFRWGKHRKQLARIVGAASGVVLLLVPTAEGAVEISLPAELIEVWSIPKRSGFAAERLAHLIGSEVAR